MPADYLHLQRVVKVFTGRGAPVRAVDDVSLSIEKGELVTLLGPSGCGKTTTLRMIAGFELADEGRIVLDGQDITHTPPNRRDTAMVFQSYALFPHLSVTENIAYGLRVKRMGGDDLRKRVAAIAEVAGLSGLLERQPNQLSGGQQQRVALARALVMEPKVLLFDEPLSNLDAKLRVQMRDQIRSLQQRFGITAVYVTHDQAEAMALSDRVVVMNRGRVEQVGPPAEIYNRPATRFVADFIGRANFLSGTVEAVDGPAVRVRTLGHVLDARASVPPTLGQQVWLVLRPEALAIGERNGAGEGLQGEVRRAVYLGALVEYDVALAGGETVSIAQHGPATQRVRAVGERVTVRVLEGAAHVLPAVSDDSPAAG